MTAVRRIFPYIVLLVCCFPSVQAAEYFRGDKFSDKLRSGGEGPPMVVLPQGKFVLGGGKASADGEGWVNIDYPIAMAVTEITRAQYRVFLEASQSATLSKFEPGGDELPVTSLSWDQVDAYTTWLSRETGHHYRLPSSSEWEYAARAGSSQHYSWGNVVGENQANCADCGAKFNGKAAPVASFAANKWGLHDMHGNVWEWARDCIDANSAPPANGMPQLFGDCERRELRGGSMESDGWSVRAGARASASRKARLPDVGFRVVREIEGDE